MSTINTSMLVHPMIWALGFAAVTIAIGYFTLFRKVELAGTAN